MKIRISDSRLNSSNDIDKSKRLNTSTQSFKLNNVDLGDTRNNLNNKPEINEQHNVFVPLDDEFDYMSNSQVTQNSDTQHTRSSLNKPNNGVKSKKNLSKSKSISPSKKAVKEVREANEIETQMDFRTKFCYNCFKPVDKNLDEPIVPCNEDFKDQVFCSKKCLKIQYLENSTFCKNEGCEKAHFLKHLGILDEGNWYCSTGCMDNGKSSVSKGIVCKMVNDHNN